MNALVKQYLVIAAKNAVNSGILAAIQVYHDPADNNFHSWHGLQGVAWIVGSAVAARELAIWLPKVLKWSSTGAVPPEEPGK